MHMFRAKQNYFMTYSAVLCVVLVSSVTEMGSEWEVKTLILKRSQYFI